MIEKVIRLKQNQLVIYQKRRLCISIAIKISLCEIIGGFLLMNGLITICRQLHLKTILQTIF